MVIVGAYVQVQTVTIPLLLRIVIVFYVQKMVSLFVQPVEMLYFCRVMKSKRLLCMMVGLLALHLVAVHAQTYVQLTDSAYAAVESDSLSLAAECLKKAVALEPGNPANVLLLIDLGSIQHQQGQNLQSVESYTLALNYKPMAMPVLLARAAVYLELGNEEKAYVDYCNVLDQNPDNEEALFFRAYIAVHQRAYDIARADYTHLLAVNPQHENGRLGLALLNQKQNRLQEATEQVGMLVKEYPDNPSYLLARADILAQQNLCELALLDFESAQKLDPSDPYIYIARAEVYLQMNRRRNARRDLDTAVAMGTPRGNLAELYRQCEK